MKPSNTILGALLAAQLILALLLLGGRGDFGATAPGTALLTFDAAAVDRIALSGGGQALVLAKQDGKWQLPDHAKLPANGIKVQNLLDQLSKLQKRHPVATSAGAAARFKVDEQGFERKIVLSQGEKPLAQLYLGDSPGYRRSYLRVAGEEAVYEGEIGSYEAATAAKDWGDPALLHIPADQIEAVESADLQLRRQEQKWTLADLGEGETLDQEAVESLVRRLANLGYLEVVEGGTEVEQGLDAPALRITLKRKEGQPREYLFGRKGDQGDFFLKSSDHPWRFKVANFTVDPLRETTREKLVKRPAVPVASETAAAEPQGASSVASESVPQPAVEAVSPAPAGGAEEAPAGHSAQGDGNP